MKRILFCLLLISFNAFSAKFLKGEGTFIAQDGDGYEFVKEQLIHEAIKSILTKELEALGLNSNLFWEKYNERLNSDNEKLEESLKLKFNITEGSSNSQVEAFKRSLRTKKYEKRKTYRKLDKMLSKYSIKKLSRSQKNPNYRTIRMEGTVNSALLTKEYYNLIRGKSQSDYGSLFIYPQFNLKGISYSEMGIENENDFEGEISKNWLKWFAANKPQNIANTELIDTEKEQILNDFLKVPSENTLLQVPEVFSHSLLIEVEVNIEKVKYVKKMNTYYFEYGGEAFLRDLQSNLVIGTYKFSKEEKTYKLKEDSNLANLIANHVYQMARGSFHGMIKSVKELTPISTIQKIELSNFKSTSRVNDFINLVEERGVRYSAKLRYNFLNKEKVSLLLYFDGTVIDVKTYFEGLRSAKKDLFFEVVESGNTLGIKFKELSESL